MKRRKDYPKYTHMTQADKWAKAYLTQCKDKRRFGTVEAAKQVAQRILEEKGLEMHCYLCPHCLNFHLTSRDLKKWKRKVF